MTDPVIQHHGYWPAGAALWRGSRDRKFREPLRMCSDTAQLGGLVCAAGLVHGVLGMAQGELPEGWEKAVKRIAKVVANRRFPGTQIAKDLPHDALSHIWEKRKFYDSEKPFEPWVRAVLRNLATDWRRKLKRRRRIDGLTGRYVEEGASVNGKENGSGQLDPEDRSWKNDWKRVEARIFPDRFFQRHLDVLKSLPVRRRVIALAIAGLWSRVPTEQWTQWLREAEIEEPFPPPECCLENGLRANIQLVADFLGQSKDVVRQHFYRAKDVLAEVLKELD